MSEQLPIEARIRPSTGVVPPQMPAPLDGVVEPVFWEGLSVSSQGAVAEALEQPPQNEATWQWQHDRAEEEQLGE